MSNHAAPEGKQVDDETIQALFSAPCDTDFAYLKPVNDPAIEAFSEAVNHAGKDKDTYEHTIQFMRLFKKPPPRASSVCSIEDDAIDKPEDLPQRPAQWHGYYALNFDMSPMLLYAWVAGTEMGIKEHGGHDLLLAPPTQKWHQKGVRGTHFKLYFAQGSGQMLIEIRHRLKLNGNPYHKEKVLEAPVLHSGTRIDIGDCSYVFAFDERTKKDPFRQEFNRFMRISVQDSLTAPHAPSTAGNMDLGRYSCPVSHFKSGASGQVGPGWTQSDGSRVLIKRFKRYDDPALKSYKRMFDKVRGHV